uniref:Uncharacterized protein n=1 Tax=Candidatus Kentrum sp. LFY TaxID=2126342 RepID=A0A450WDF0_9GAMM|nr:MAG: protein of unknown function (DUF955) [Candidatus Kentron sp. LFY]
MNQAIRERVAERLRSEAVRKQIRPESLPGNAEVSEQIAAGYLDGSRELRWDEFRRICRALDTDPLWLLSPAYQAPRLIYRNAAPPTRRRAAHIENAFLVIGEELPKARRPRLFLPNGPDDPGELLTLLDPMVSDLRDRHGDTIELYRDHRLPVLGVWEENAFDAFLMASGSSHLVCVNLNTPDARMEFSLLHEFSHFAFDADRDLPIDVRLTGSDLYGDRINEKARPEYIANKFAQLWLVPWEAAQKMAMKWPNCAPCAHYIREHRVSPDVVANALYDVLRFRASPPAYQRVQQSVRDSVPEWRGRSEIRGFVKEETRTLREQALSILEDAEEGRRKEILSAWGFADG